MEYNQSMNSSTSLREGVYMWCVIHYTAECWSLTVNNVSKVVHQGTNQGLHDFDRNFLCSFKESIDS